MSFYRLIVFYLPVILALGGLVLHRKLLIRISVLYLPTLSLHLIFLSGEH